MGQLDYALVGNCQISGILDREARFVWCCFPRFDSPAVFASLVSTPEAGSWSVLPEGQPYETRQRYLRNTNVVQTEFHLKNGDRYDVFDFAPRFTLGSEHFRPPQLIRIIRVLKGNPRVCMRLQPRFDYGRVTPTVALTGDGLVYRGEGDSLYLQTDIPLTYLQEERPFELTGTRYCVLSHGEPFGLPLKFGCEEYYDRTVAYWRLWVKHCNIPFEYQEEVIRSALALKLHTFEDTGAIIAATTTSIPESAHGNRTWDYRFCWLRDAYFVITALNQLGHFEEMERFIQFLHNLAGEQKESELQPVYGIGGERALIERTLPWLKGFHGIGPVRIGNAAYTHSQYDIYGEMVLAVTPIFFDSRLERTDLNRAFANVTHLVERAIATFELPDSGLWEFRSDPRHHVFSKLLCWAAVDRGVKIARRTGRSEQYAHWAGAAARMRATIEARAWNEKKGMYTQVLDGDTADASNLLMGLLGYSSPDDVRFRRSVEACEKELMSSGYVFRYRSADDFGVPKNAFTICTFWLVDALAMIGRKEEARAIFERVLARVNHVGLLSEDIDPASGELWGNFPQTYSHVGVITSAFRLSKKWEEAF